MHKNIATVFLLVVKSILASEIDMALNELDQEDPKLIEAIRERLLLPPSKEKYNFTDAKIDLRGQFDQGKHINYN